MVASMFKYLEVPFIPPLKGGGLIRLGILPSKWSSIFVTPEVIMAGYFAGELKNAMDSSCLKLA